LIFDGAANTITLVDKSGKVVGIWPASDNVCTRATVGKLVDGSDPFLDTSSPHLHVGSADTARGAFGPDGIFRLQQFEGADGKEHTGVGIHAGRAGVPDALGRTGAEHATMGCVRTCAAATGAMRELAKTDPLQTLKVIHNRKAKICAGQTPCGETVGSGANAHAEPSGARSGGGPEPQPQLISYYHGLRQRQAGTNRKPEDTLSGVIVGETTIPQAIATIGPPSKFEEKTGPDVPKGSGDRTYTWFKGQVALEISTEFYSDNCDRGKYYHGTGDQVTHGFRYVYHLECPRANYDQENGSLSVDADALGRIVHISVVGPE